MADLDEIRHRLLAQVATAGTHGVDAKDEQSSAAALALDNDSLPNLLGAAVASTNHAVIIGLHSHAEITSGSDDAGATDQHPCVDDQQPYDTIGADGQLTQDMTLPSTRRSAVLAGAGPLPAPASAAGPLPAVRPDPIAAPKLQRTPGPVSEDATMSRGADSWLMSGNSGRLPPATPPQEKPQPLSTAGNQCTSAVWPPPSAQTARTKTMSPGEPSCAASVSSSLQEWTPPTPLPMVCDVGVVTSPASSPPRERSRVARMLSYEQSSPLPSAGRSYSSCSGAATPLPPSPAPIVETKLAEGSAVKGSSPWPADEVDLTLTATPRSEAGSESGSVATSAAATEASRFKGKWLSRLDIETQRIARIMRGAGAGDGDSGDATSSGSE
eukprot:gnl/TRDRNA2_/TRDRNA2_163151_c1_seq1.p1 gnl/TRDRNA2_/TRDRNA2_163151_c1~~gnl/TRDRNA2_/TRDRNA2_163151_c1_seq1.p1  ORF type:complete len:397 (+),score=75.82 gnl/TRDRNA2_/TRDRNA2_163151_c1_seq1:40-1191(+)